MGRHAEAHVTSETVGEAVAQLKPEKSEAWRRDANRLGLTFEEYGVEKIRRNIEYKRWRWPVCLTFEQTPPSPMVCAHDSASSCEAEGGSLCGDQDA